MRQQSIKVTLFLSSSLVLATAPGLADTVEKIIVTGTRIGELPEDKLGTAVTVITNEQIENRQTTYVAEILRDVPSIAVNRSGGAGGATQVRMRGSEANHTLVLLDGAEINDPFQGEFDFAGLLAGDIERIEILRGSQSALYGSDAIGGVINLIAKRGTSDLAIKGTAEGGSFNTWTGAANASFGTEVFDFFAATSYHSTSGTNNSRFGDEEDGASERSYFVNTGLQLARNIELRGLLRSVITRAEGDPQDFDFFSPTQGFVVDGDDVTHTRALYGNVQLETSSFDGMLESKLAYSFADGARRNYSFGAPSFFSEGHRDKVSFVSSLKLTTDRILHNLTGALDWKNESYQNLPLETPTPVNDKRYLQNIGAVISYDVEYNDLNAGIAIRHDRNEGFEHATTYRLQAGYKLGDTRLRATAGSGIKNPNNFELFGFDPATFIGNPGLKPEKSLGWDIGVDQYLLDKSVKLTMTYFSATLEDEIFTAFLPGFIATPKNRTSQSDRQGIELTADAEFNKWDFAAQYTFTKADEKGIEEVRRPEHMASLHVTYHVDPDLDLTLGLRHNGKQQDNEFIFATPEDFVTLDAFTLVNLYGSYRATRNIEVYARVENLLDEKYEEVFSFASPGISAYAGVKLRM